MSPVYSHPVNVDILPLCSSPSNVSDYIICYHGEFPHELFNQLPGVSRSQQIVCIISVVIPNNENCSIETDGGPTYHVGPPCVWLAETGRAMQSEILVSVVTRTPSHPHTLRNSLLVTHSSCLPSQGSCQTDGDSDDFTGHSIA